jgi:hypothetical protein
MKYPSIVLEDNTAAELMTRNVGVTDRPKHIQQRWHYIRQCVQDGTFRFERLKSKENPSDALTKASSSEMMEVMFRATGLRITSPDTT